MEWIIGYWRISIERVFPTIDQLTQIYDGAAPNWHHILQRLGYNRAYAQLFQTLQKSGVLDNLKDNSCICDCGIGTGAFSLALVNTVTAKLNVIGVDISPQMLDKAKQTLQKVDINYQFYQNNVTALPFPDATFDLLVSAHMLEHLPNPLVGLQEMARVLRPGAAIVLAVTPPGLLGFWIQWRWGNDCFTPKFMEQMMTDAGLSNIRFYPFTFGLSRWTSIVCLGFR
jgi:SAM-dependent methyltransferase